MELTDLHQTPFKATLMGCIEGASEYFGLDWSAAKLCGHSTHAFLIHIHADLRPSSPYVWTQHCFFLAL